MVVSKATLPKPLSALHEILKWSENRPEWQRDALRRIIVKGCIEDSDIHDLANICRTNHNAHVSTNPPVTVEPLTDKHLPPGPGSEESVTLVSIGNLQHVNRLPSDQEIHFGNAPGLAVIYGDNGSGKSGYARVIKKSCRARGESPVIHPNAFLPASPEIASAKIVCQVSGKDIPIVWMDNKTADSRLANVFVFDGFSAKHYLQEDRAATFTPYGLHVLPLLSKVCDRIRELIQQDINATKLAISGKVQNWNYIPTTLVGKLIRSLAATTKTEGVEMLAGLDTKQEQRLKDLREALKSDPKQKVKETRAAAARIKSFKEKVETITKDLSDERINKTRRLVENVKSTSEQAKAFAAGQFDLTYLPGSGTTELWQKMWDAAQAFSNFAAYKDQKFPVTEEDARCLLCQQILDGKAIERFKAFDAFCKDESQQLAITAAKRLKDEADGISNLSDLSPEFI